MLDKLSVKVKIFAGFVAMLAMPAGSAFAAYPINRQPYQQPQIYQPYQQPVQYQQPQYGIPPQVGVQPGPVRQGYIPPAQIARMPQATAPGRITGALPKVGNAYVNAGRKYYQPEGFDRLADSGLYVGLSIGYTYSINGGMNAEYVDKQNSWFVPGAFQQANFAHDTVMPIQISVGASINNDVRVDFSYLRYSGMAYPDVVMTSDGFGLIPAVVTDGRISSTATMLNLYYNLDSYTGVLASGSMRPYVGLGLGISTNTISDYLVYDKSFYPEVEDGVLVDAGKPTGISDVYAYHSGGTTEQLAYALEVGFTTELEGGLKLDFFVRWANLGRVESSGSIVVTQTEWISTGQAPTGYDGAEFPSEFDSVYHYTNWKESGSLTALDMGIRMRVQF